MIQDAWTDQGSLRLVDRDVADCWGWENFYLGIEIAGTITTELSLRAPAPTDDSTPNEEPRLPARRVAQHAPSGGGRSFPQHRRQHVIEEEEGVGWTVLVQAGEGFRRTWIQRTREEIAEAGRLLGLEALEMNAPDLSLYPSPSALNCPSCDFQALCLEMYRGADPGPLLARDYRTWIRPAAERARLGKTTWTTGRGAAPPLGGR